MWYLNDVGTEEPAESVEDWQKAAAYDRDQRETALWFSVSFLITALVLLFLGLWTLKDVRLVRREMGAAQIPTADVATGAATASAATGAAEATAPAPETPPAEGGAPAPEAAPPPESTLPPPVAAATEGMPPAAAAPESASSAPPGEAAAPPAAEAEPPKQA
jgi:outer membrane biosynthesis protein TonB